MIIKKLIKTIPLLLIFLVFTSPTLAAELTAEKFSTNFFIEYNKVLVDTNINFEDPVNGTLMFTLPLDARAITAHIDGGKIDPDLELNVLRIKLYNNKHLRFQYISNTFLERKTFLANVRIPLDTNLLEIRLSLPENSVLERAIHNADVSSPSIFPKPTRLETNGRVIDAVWIAKDVKKGKEFPFMAGYIFPGRTTRNVLIVISIILILALVLNFFYKKSNAPVIQKITHPFNIEKHLKEDEEQIVNILNKKEGSCEQGTLRVITGFSKAKLSGLLKELEERKIIHKEKRGKKNVVFLKE